MTQAVQSLGWVDGLFIIIIVISVAVGLWRGLVFEVLSLLGWVAAYVAAQALAPRLAPHLPVGDPGSGINVAAAFALAFVGAMIVWSIGARLVRMLIHLTPLTVFDRLLGGGFGLLRALLLLLVAATVVAMTPAEQSASWQASSGAAWLGVLLKGIQPLLPAEVGRHLPD